MTYTEVTNFLFSQLPMYQRQGVSAFKKDLKNIIALCEILGNPHLRFKSIHIAGTNGKGSVAHMIAAGLQANGYKVGLYTSPHYKDYRERIKINGEFISEDEVIHFVETHKADFVRIQPSFFEITVALAFHFFAAHKVDVAIIETGLGGRLDSTNIIHPILSVITNISFDHQSMLGNTLIEIAGEKAGIIKEGIPVIIGEFQEEIFEVFKNKAEKHSSEIIIADRVSSVDITSNSEDSIIVSYQKDDKKWIDEISTNLSNPYQLKNLVTALTALFMLRKTFALDPVKIGEGVEHIHQLTYFIGRWTIIQSSPKIILESAHNEAGIMHLAAQIKKLSFRKLHIVWGSASDKDVGKVLSLMPKEATYYFAKANIPRGMKVEKLSKIAQDIGLDGASYASVPAAFRMAKAYADSEDLIIVAGSIFVVAEVV